MCGIAGYVGFKPPPAAALEGALEIIKHRGPDSKGCYVKMNNRATSVAMLHTRLGIVDLDERSNQPFIYQDSALIFNGEIYNYKSIRLELEGLGVCFQTEGDTEVLAQALFRWGEAALERLEGMWAFAWYRESTGELILGRDRFGEKPLYYWKTNCGLYFGSEIKVLACLAQKWPEIDENHLIGYMVNGYKSLFKSNTGFYREIKFLPPGNILKISGNYKCLVKRYWNPILANVSKKKYCELVGDVRESLINSVKLRLGADVPLAFCMSGGIDSNSIIAIAKKILDYDVTGFTLQNTDSRYEELELVSQAVFELGINHRSVDISNENFLDNLKKLIEIRDTPVSTISYYVQWQLMKQISIEGFKVTVSGTGADELFTGYHDHHNLYLAEISGDSKQLKESLESWSKFQKNVVRNPFLKNPTLFIEDPKFRKHIYLDADHFSTYLNNEWQGEFIEHDYNVGLLRGRMLNELFHEVVPPILCEDDANAMYFSMENRSPFLDTDLFKLAYSIPSQFLIRDAMTKVVLRDAMRGIVPDVVLNNRNKIGFNAPISDLLGSHDTGVLEEIMDSDLIFQIVDKDKISKLINKNYFKNSESKFLFNFINASIFLERQRKRSCRA